jgi:hypothetical protein
MSKTLVQIQRGGEEAVTVPLPTWTDPTSVAAWITGLLGAVNTILVLTHTGYNLPPDVTASVAPVSAAVAAFAVLLNLWRHTKVTVAALTR